MSNVGFRGFAKPLFNKAVKITNITAKFFGISKPAEVFYTIKDGNWTDITIWETASKRHGKIPTINDDVYIHHSVNLPSSITTSCNNFFISSSGIFTFLNNANLTVYGNIKCKGTLIMVAFAGLAIFGDDNNIDNYSLVSNSVISYVRVGDQKVLGLNYGQLTIGGTGLKYAIGDITTTGHFQIGGNFDIKHYNFTGGLTTTIFGAGTIFYATGSGHLLFTSVFNSSNGTNRILWTGNPTIEFRGGTLLIIDGAASDLGTGDILFTTNSQTWGSSGNRSISYFNNIYVVGAITVTADTTNWAYSYGDIQGTVAGSALINKGVIYHYNSAYYTPMSTFGTFDHTTFNTSVMGYIFNGSITLPFLTYQGLHIHGTGTKTVSGNTSVSTELKLNLKATPSIAAILEVATYNLTVSGTTIIGFGCTLKKSGSGNLLFIGRITLGSSNGTGFLDMSGSPSIEFRGGISYFAGTLDWGLGTCTFTTNNQTILTLNASVPGTMVVNNAVINNVEISLNSTIPINHVLAINGSIDGTTGGSKLINNGNVTLYTTTIPMATGVLDITTFDNTVSYLMIGNYTLPYGNYKSLIIGGTGTKTASMNIVTAGLLRINGPSIFELSTFDLTVGTTTTLTLTGCTLSKTGAGNILFIGNVTGVNYNSGFIFSGNPNVEFRNGFSFANVSIITSGNGVWSFTTNNQLFTCNVSTNPYVITAQILISGAITLTISTSTLLQYYFSNVIDGNNAASKLDNRGTINYQNATLPMVTGLLECNAAANTFKYNMLGAQAVKGGAYRTMEFGGSGVKTLQGNVTNTSRSTTGTASINLNGFTLIP